MLLLLSAGALLFPASIHPTTWIPINPDVADADVGPSAYWRLSMRGLEGMSHRLLAWPIGTQELLRNGVPLDGLIAWPFLNFLGFSTGYTVFLFTMLTLTGWSMAWLALRWWGSHTGALLAGLVWQSSPFLLSAIAAGQPHVLVSSALLPAALVLFISGLNQEKMSTLIGAGVVAGLAVVTYWHNAYGVVVAATLTLLPAALSGKRAGFAAFWALLGLLFVAVYPLLGAWVALAEQGGVTLSGGSAEGGLTLSGALAAPPLVLGYAVGGMAMLLPTVRRAPKRQWAVPLLWGVAGVVLGAGPLVAGVVPAPYLLSLELPLARYLWSPYSVFQIASLGLALLIAGVAVPRTWPAAARYGTPVLLTALVVGSALLINHVPLPVINSRTSATARALATRTGPVLMLPQPGGLLRRQTGIFLDQIFHKRPIINTVLPEKEHPVPQSLMGIRHIPAMQYLSDCEQGEATLSSADRSMFFGQLNSIGVSEVYLDLRYVDDTEAGSKYVGCIQALFGEPLETLGELQVYSLTALPAQQL